MDIFFFLQHSAVVALFFSLNFMIIFYALYNLYIKWHLKWNWIAIDISNATEMFEFRQLQRWQMCLRDRDSDKHGRVWIYMAPKMTNFYGNFYCAEIISTWNVTIVPEFYDFMISCIYIVYFCFCFCFYLTYETKVKTMCGDVSSSRYNRNEIRIFD